MDEPAAVARPHRGAHGSEHVAERVRVDVHRYPALGRQELVCIGAENGFARQPLTADPRPTPAFLLRIQATRGRLEMLAAMAQAARWVRHNSRCLRSPDIQH